MSSSNVETYHQTSIEDDVLNGNSADIDNFEVLHEPANGESHNEGAIQHNLPGWGAAPKSQSQAHQNSDFDAFEDGSNASSFGGSMNFDAESAIGMQKSSIEQARLDSSLRSLEALGAELNNTNQNENDDGLYPRSQDGTSAESLGHDIATQENNKDQERLDSSLQSLETIEDEFSNANKKAKYDLPLLPSSANAEPPGNKSGIQKNNSDQGRLNSSIQSLETIGEEFSNMDKEERYDNLYPPAELSSNHIEPAATNNQIEQVAVSKPANGSLSLPPDELNGILDYKSLADISMPTNGSSQAASTPLHSTGIDSTSHVEEFKHDRNEIQSATLPYSSGVTSNQENNQLDTQVNNKRPSPDVIEIIDDDDGDENDISGGGAEFASAKRLRAEQIPSQMMNAGEESYQSRLQHMPDWMHSAPNSRMAIPTVPTSRSQPIIPGSSRIDYNDQINSTMNAIAQSYPQATWNQPSVPRAYYGRQPEYLQLPTDFVPTWNQLLPPVIPKPIRNDTGPVGVFRNYRLSLLNCNEFGVTGDIRGLRSNIKQISRGHGKAVYERLDGEDGDVERWRVPLGAYHAFVAFLQSDPNSIVEPIPPMQLNVASLGKARLEKGFPSAEKVMKSGVPAALANALAPFQRGGVDFVLEKDGRALIADEMGLGKTVQGIASMSMYQKEWPLLVLCPSSARYHWESEFRNWLGYDGNAVKSHESESRANSNSSSASSVKCSFQLLKKTDIHVLSSSKGKVIPTADIKVVICSYGLAPMLAKSNRIYPGQFKCAIADESHMLKNMATKRTSLLLPILVATKRCVLLSGTPALSRPAELWPQLMILGTDRYGWWQDEREYMDKYVKNGTASRRAELHTMLTGTVMIRRLKADILKTMKPKRREKAMVHVPSKSMRAELHECMKLLRQGKGILGKLAKQHTAIGDPIDSYPDQDLDHARGTRVQQPTSSTGANMTPFASNTQAQMALRQEVDRKYAEGQQRIDHTLRTTNHQLSDRELSDLRHRLHSDLRREVDVYYQERMHELKNGPVQEEQKELTPKTVLNHMYNLTAKTKIPIVLDMLKRWLRDPTKGKVCIFAHHLSVLDEIQKEAGLSNSGKNGCHPFIRIDGATNPKARFEQIDSFQKNPSVRVALLGITAAGVAVTLTASSTVWFAELFWTPAIMIQAEDRCHRIGQQAVVQCLYFVAKGTLDDVLWKLLEKKLQDIGEFVEGQEKLKLVVHQTYKDEQELKASMTESSNDYLSDEDSKPLDPADADKDGLEFDNDLQQAIEELGQEQQKELMRSMDLDDDEIDRKIKPENQMASADEECVLLPEGPTSSQGHSQEEAIALSDDEEDTPAQESKTRNKAVPPNPESGEEKRDASKGDGFDMFGTLPNCRLYKLVLHEQKLGVSVGIFKRRIVMSSKARRGKPDIGDVLVACNGSTVPQCNSLNEVLDPLQRAIQQFGATELIFAEDGEFADFYRRSTRGRKSKEEPSDVIEIIED